MAEAPAATPAARVLVVDDEPAVRASLERALVAGGYAVTLAGDGEEALDRLVAGRFDLVVLDVMMPRPGRARGRPPAAGGRRPHPVLMLTARDAVDDRVPASRRAPTTTS